LATSKHTTDTTGRERNRERGIAHGLLVIACGILIGSPTVPKTVHMGLNAKQISKAVHRARIAVAPIKWRQQHDVYSMCESLLKTRPQKINNVMLKPTT